MRRKFKVIDTNVALRDGLRSLAAFLPDEGETSTTLVITPTLINETENFKGDRGDRGAQARAFHRALDEIVRESSTTLREGIFLKDNYQLLAVSGYDRRIDDTYPHIKPDADGLLLKICLDLKEKHPDFDAVELVTEDTALRNQAALLGIKANPWKDQQAVADVSAIYKGWRHVQDAPERVIADLRSQKSVSPSDMGLSDLRPNEYLILSSAKGGKNTLGRFSLKENNGSIMPLYQNRKYLEERMLANSAKVPFIKPRSPRQTFLMDALADPTIPLVFALGPAGTGKTFLSIEAAYLHALRISDAMQPYQKVGLIRSVVEDEENLGFYPGEMNEKIKNWMLPFHDNLIELGTKYHFTEEHVIKYFDKGLLEYAHIGHLRGRSLTRGIFIVDDGQNLTKQTTMKIITRAGTNTKFIITGDPHPDQIDRKELTPQTCGIVWANQKLASSEYTATVCFEPEDVERSVHVREFLKLLS